MQAALSAATTWLAKGVDAPLYAALLHSSRAFVVGRGFEYPNALELALKLRETSGMFSDGYSAADLFHGPIASAHADVPAIVLATDPKTEAGVAASIDRLRGVGAPLLVIHTSGAASRGLRPGEELALPTGPSGPLCTPVTAIAGLAIIEAVATGRGLNPDAPAGLTKVTKTL
jgi:glucosamine--fructose-6-phosphate aminotransferase (isomerizing)